MDYIAFMSGVAIAFIAHAVRKKKERPVEKLKQALFSYAAVSNNGETGLSSTYTELSIKPQTLHLNSDKECELFFNTFIRNVAHKAKHSQSYT